MAGKKALGKGLGALMPDMPIFEEKITAEEGSVIKLKPQQLRPDPDQPRKNFAPDKLAELAASIKQVGIIQPLLVTKAKEAAGESYLIVAGERRYRAALEAGLEELPCIVKELGEKELAELSLIENLQREDLDPVEEARGCQALLESYGYTQEQLGERLGKSRSYLANTLRLLKLEPQYLQLLQEGRITPGHARAALSLEGEQRVKLIDTILEKDLSVRQAEMLAAAMKEEKKPTPERQDKVVQVQLRSLEKELRQAMGMGVSIKGSEKKGKLIISYNTAADLDALYMLLKEGRR